METHRYVYGVHVPIRLGQRIQICTKSTVKNRIFAVFSPFERTHTWREVSLSKIFNALKLHFKFNF